MIKKRKRKTAAEKRIEILKDAMLQIEAGRYKPAHGVYCSLNYESNFKISEIANSQTNPYAVELNKYLDVVITPRKPCHVCAKGALAVSAIAKFNDYSLGRAKSQGITDASDRARKYLGVRNADNMEIIFESWRDKGISDKIIDKWYKRYPNSTKRILAIFRNAIRNKGIFKP